MGPSGHHLIKIIASCLSLWEHLLRTLWNSIDIELPFISQGMEKKREKAGISSLLSGSYQKQRRFYVLFRYRCIKEEGRLSHFRRERRKISKTIFSGEYQRRL
jgi:hypothetical protein